MERIPTWVFWAGGAALAYVLYRQYQASQALVQGAADQALRVGTAGNTPGAAALNVVPTAGRSVSVPNPASFLQPVGVSDVSVNDMVNVPNTYTTATDPAFWLPVQ